MQPITTKLTKLLSKLLSAVPDSGLSIPVDVRTPLVSAPMAFASTPELASAVTAAGGFGFIGAGALQPFRASVPF